MKPTIGRVVIYKPNEEELETMRAKSKLGQCNVCQELPAVIVNVWSDDFVNLKVILDGEGTMWSTSRKLGDLPGEWNWPPHIRREQTLTGEKEGRGKTLSNTTASQAKENVSDIKFWGDGDTFKLISKASSKDEGWMKSTKAMEIPSAGCVVQITTQQGENIAEAVTFVPGVKIREVKDTEGAIVSRQIVSSR